MDKREVWMVIQLLGELNFEQLQRDNQDRWQWLGEEDGKYYDKSSYAILKNTYVSNTLFK